MNSSTSSKTVSFSSVVQSKEFTSELSTIVGKRRSFQTMETEEEISGEVFTVSQDFKADDSESLSVQRGEKVVLLSTKGKDPSKRTLFEIEDIDLGFGIESLLDNTAAKHKMAVKPKRNHATTRISSVLPSRWKVQSMKEPEKKGWVPIVVLSPEEDSPETQRTQDLIFRREAVISELVETEEEYCRDLIKVVDRYLRPLDGSSVPRNVSDNKDTVFGNFKEISEFHNTVLLEGIKYYANEPKALGKTFLRMERDFDKHVAYCHDEPTAQEFLQENEEVREFFDDLGARLRDDKTLSEHLKLPIQRINDYQLLLKELVKYSERLGEDTTDLCRALELMLGIPNRANDLKFITNIEGYHGDIHKLGRLLRHNWFKVKGKDGKTHDRYLFLFKARILVCKVRKITEDRYVFVLKEIIRLPDVELKDHRHSPRVFEIGPVTLTSHQDHVKEPWIAEIKHYARNALTLAEHAADDLRLQEDENKNLEPLKGVELHLTPGYTPSDEEMEKSSRKTSLSKRVEAGGAAVFECEIEAKSVVWLKDNRPLADKLADRVTQMSDGHLHRLEILNVIESDAGVYTAHATTAEGVISTCTANLVVYRLSDEERRARAEANAPHFLVMLKDTELLENTYLRFMVKVKGNPNPVVKFFKDDELITYHNERVAINNDNEATGYYELVIPEVKTRDTGTYKCVASNKYGDASSEGKVTVVDDKNIFVGIKEPKGEPEFQWIKNGQPFDPEERFKVLLQDDEDSLALVFTHVKPEDAGLYTCVASTSTGKISCSAELTVQGNVNLLFREPEAPTIKSSSKETETNIGSSAMLETKITGYPKPETKWMKDGVDIVMSERYKILYEDEETIALVIKNVTLADMGEYKCVAYNVSGEDSDTVFLNVKAPPMFTKKLQDVSTLAGQEIRLSVTIEANPKPMVAWYKDGKQVLESEHIKIVEENSTYSLLIEKCTLNDVGSYSIVCKNNISQCSEFCKVEIAGAPVFTRNLIKRVDLEENDSLTFLVKVHGNPMPTVQWFYKGNPVKQDTRCKISHDMETHTLTINAINREDAGEYSCHLTNMHGTTIDHGLVCVKCSPTFRKGLGHLIAQEGDSNVGFTVDVESFPKGKVRWYHNGVEITESKKEFAFKEEEDSYTLVLKEVNRELYGKYTCKIENTYGSEESSAELTVLCKPKFKKALKDVTVNEGDTLTLQIEIDGTPDPQIKWYKDGQEVTTDAHIKISRDSKRMELYELTVDLIKAEDGGEYEVRALNEQGVAVSKSIVLVQTAPVITSVLMKDVDIFETWENIYSITATGNPVPQAKWYKDGVEISSSERIKITSEDGVYKLETLDCQLTDSAEYKVVITNILGEASASAKLNIVGAKDFRLPQIRTPLYNKNVQKTQTAIQSVVLTADPIPEVKWEHDGKDIDPEFITNCESKMIDHGLKECTYTLTIPSSRHADTGTYSFYAVNKSGEASCEARLDIILKPEIEIFKDIVGVPYEDSQFIAVIRSNPRAKITWRKDGNKIESNDHYTIDNDPINEVYKLTVKGILLEDAGTYTVSAVNDVGEASADARLKMHMEEPEFTKGLNDVTVREYAQLDMKVRAQGVPKPELRWTKDNVDLVESEGMTLDTRCEGHVSSHLNIPHFKPEHAGLYKVKAYSLAGHSETHCFVKLAQLAPMFSKNLERAVTVDEGEPLDLRCKIEASPLATVKWFKDGTELIATDHVQLVHKPDGSVRLRIEESTPEDCGAYKLVIENSLGANTTICAVAVQPSPRRPVFMEKLKDVSLQEGELLKLEAKIMAFPLPELKWFKDGLPVRPSRAVNFVNSPGGVVGLIVDKVLPEHTGRYTLTATNKLGEETCAAEVEVIMKDRRPEFHSHLTPTCVVEGFPLKLTVKMAGNPKPHLVWSQNGTPIDIDGERVKVIESPNGDCSLLIDKVSPLDAGVYSVTASNPAGTITSEAKVEIAGQNRDDMPEEEPSFAYNMRDTWAEEGSPVSLSVPFKGNPVPSVTWIKNGVPLAPDPRINMTNDGNKIGLTISPSEMKDHGEYMCILENPLGKAETSAKMTIKKVFHAPVFIHKFHDLEQVIGLDGKLACKATGNPRPEVTWFKNGKPIFDCNKFHMKQDGDNYVLLIKDCSPDDDGYYKCVATNRDGKAECEAQFRAVDKIMTKEKGEAPCFLKKIGDQEVINGITGRFTACISGFPEPEVEWFRNNDRLFPSDRINMERESSGLLRLTIAHVDPAVDCGKYRLRIFNDYGEDECEANFLYDSMGLGERKSVGEQYKDFDDFKQKGAPMPLADRPIISRMTDRRLTLSWKPSIPFGPREPVTYLVEMCELPNGNWFTARSGIRSCTCEIHNLQPFRDYKFRVCVENKYGVSDPSPFAITYRAKLEPDPPKFIPYLAPGIDFRPETSPYFPKDFDIERPPHDGYSQAPRFLRQEHYTQYGVKGHNCNLFWFVYGYPKPKMTYYFNDEPIEMGGRYDCSYTRNGQATLFINKMLDRDVGTYEAVARNEHGEARQRVHLEIAEYPEFIRRPEEITIIARHSGKIEARVTGVPLPDIKWFKDWQPLAPSSRIKINRLDPDLCMLVINESITKDSGLYSISASNVAGAISCSVMIHVEEKDDRPYYHYGRGHNVKPKTKVITDFYDLGDELGRGTQGITYHAVERASGRNYAAKVMHGRGELKSLMNNEIEVMNTLNHHKILRIHDAYETLDGITIVMELASGGELLDTLTKQPYTNETEIANYIRQLLVALDHMHDQNIAHLGLTIGDLLISHPGGDDLKLADYGLGRRIHLAQLLPLDYGMPEFVAPEVIRGEGVDMSADMWSVGIITYLLLTGISLFRGRNDMETLAKIKEGFWEFHEELFKNFTTEARDFISKLLEVDAKVRMDVKTALRHPWLNYADKYTPNQYDIPTETLHNYYNSWKDWYSNASCRTWYRRRPLEGAFIHPSKMVYPLNYIATPTESPEREMRDKDKKQTWIDQLPSRQPLNYDIGVVSSESHYQNGPDTYLLQLRDVDFPVRIREYMKVAAHRSATSLTRFDDTHVDLRLPVIRERRRFTDVMDEEIDDERKNRINQYGLGDIQTVRRLKHEVGPRLDTHVEAEALIEASRQGQPPFLREKPQLTPIEEGQPAQLVCYAVGDPKPTIQWFKNDMMIGNSNRIKIEDDDKGRSVFKFLPASSVDTGIYKVVARNRMGQTISRTRVVLATIPDPPDSPHDSDRSDTQILLRWRQPKHDGNSPILCYSLQYKAAEAAEWKDVNANIDHEFYLVRGLQPSTGYNFRLSSRNKCGWSEPGIPTDIIRTLEEGCPRIEMSQAMKHLQEISESGKEVHEETGADLDYSVESSPVQWTKQEPTDKYSFISEISRGRFSVVVKAIDKTNDKVVVAKLMDCSPNTKHKVDAEFEVLRSLRHERIASMIHACQPFDSTYSVLVFEKLQGADVLTYLSSRHEYTEQTVATIITQILDGLQYLHWRGFCHLDLQPDNVVMASVRCVQVKLVDLGSAQRVTKLGNVVGFHGSVEFTAPEVLCQEPAYPQSDIWSVGVLAYVMLSGVSPFKGENIGETRQNINFVRFRFEHLFKELTQEATRFLMLVFKRCPTKRPSAEECHEHRWLLPSEYMIKRRERAIFLGNRLKEFTESYHRLRMEEATTMEALTNLVTGKGPLERSNSIQEELITSD